MLVINLCLHYFHQNGDIMLSFISIAAASIIATGNVPSPDWTANIGQAKIKVYQVQNEKDPDQTGGYDWGPCVMKDGDIYRMWWTRPCPPSDKTFPYHTTDNESKPVVINYPLRGDRIFYAESKDGHKWNLCGTGSEIDPKNYTFESPYPIIIIHPAFNKNEKTHVASPSVIKVNGTYYLYYESPAGYKVTKDDKGNPSCGMEYHNQVFLATSTDCRTWKKWPRDDAPQPIVKAPVSNFEPGKRRYGLGQPSVCYKNGKFIMHYVDSCTWYPDTIIRIESDEPTFRNARRVDGFKDSLGQPKPPPAGAVAKFAQTDVCWLGDSYYLVRQVYGVDRIAILRSESGVFWSDEPISEPLLARNQFALHDPRGVIYRGRMAPRFLRGPHGELIGDERHFTIFYGSGNVDGPGWTLYTLDIHRADIELIKPLEKDTKKPIN